MGNSYFEALAVGFNNAISQLGENNFNFVYTGPDTAGALRQLPYIEEAVKAGADAIFIAANSDTGLNGAFDKARSAGVRVYSINQDIPGSEAHRDAAILPVPFDVLGAAQVEFLAAQMGYRGEFAILSATREAPDQNTWIAFMREELKKHKYSRMRLVDIVYGKEEREASRKAMRELIGKHPNLRGVIAPTTVGLLAASSIVRELGLAAKIKITGVGLPSEMEEFVLDGTCGGFYLWNPTLQGYMAAFLVWNEKMEGVSPEPAAVFSAGKLGEYTILPSGQIYTSDAPVLYTKANIQEAALLF
jgi:rhamnose transport system substrate-binding protein